MSSRITRAIVGVTVLVLVLLGTIWRGTVWTRLPMMAVYAVIWNKVVGGITSGGFGFVQNANTNYFLHTTYFSFNPPFAVTNTYRSIANLPLAERVVKMKDPDIRRRIIAEHGTGNTEGIILEITTGFHKMFAMEDPVNYEPSPERSVAGLAKSSGRTPQDIAYDMLLQRDGNQLFYMPLFNWAHENLNDTREMLLAPRSLIGLSDAGAHCGAISDGSFSTTMLALWGRDRTRGEKLPIEQHAPSNSIGELRAKRTEHHVRSLRKKERI